MGKLDKVLQIEVILPSLEMYRLFQMDNLLWNLSSTPSQIVINLKINLFKIILF